MDRKTVLLLAAMAAGIAILITLAETSPGYMDANYYYAGGLRLFQGHGFSELVLWNYLDEPAGLPHPSHGYWMPLVSVVAAAGMLLGGNPSFAAARTIFILVALSLPFLSSWLALRLSGRRDHALLAGLLAVFPGYYLAFLYTTESFGLYMLFGGLFLGLLAVPRRQMGSEDDEMSPEAPQRRALARSPAKWVGLGALAGLMHLTRADGLIWIGVGLLFVIITERPPRRWASAVAFIAGYLAVMGAWLLHNLLLYGSPLTPGGSRALWLVNYDELFSFPGSRLTFDHWWSSGPAAIAATRLRALGTNLQNALAVQGLVFLGPLTLLGMWRLRCNPAVQAGAMAWLITLGIMTVVFPFQGSRGGFFHSGAALQPLFWAVTPAGFDAFLEWGTRQRGWNASQAKRVFGFGLVALAAMVTALVTIQRLQARGSDRTANWNTSWQRYAQVEGGLQAWGARTGQVVMVNDAPGYFASAGRPSISIPYGDLQTVLSAADHFDAAYLVVELDQVQGETLFSQPGDRPGLRYLGAFSEVQVYAIDTP